MSPDQALAERPRDLSHTFHRQVIGYLGLLLPVLLVVLAWIRATQGKPWDPSSLGSVRRRRTSCS